MRVRFFDEEGNLIDRGVVEEALVQEERVTTLDKQFTVLWAGDLQWDQTEEVLVQPVMIRPDY